MSDVFFRNVSQSPRPRARFGALLVALVCAATIGCGKEAAQGPDGTQGPAGTQGPTGASCTVESIDGSSARVVCEDGTTAVVTAPAAEPGASCSVTQETGQIRIGCDDGTEVIVRDGVDGESGDSCSVEETEEGHVLIVCDDGSSADLGRPLPEPADPSDDPLGELGIELLAGVISVGSSDGLGSETRMDGALDGAFDPAGEFLYFVDSFNMTVRRFGLNTQRVVTIAGTPGRKGASDGVGPDASFEGPRGVAMHPDGDRLFIADGFNCTIRQLELATREVTTLAGQAGECAATDGAFEDARFRLTIGMTMDPTGRYLYAADRGNNVIRRLDLETRTVETIAGRLPTEGGNQHRGHQDGVGVDAQFAGPGGIDLSADASTLYINDTFNNVIRALVLESDELTEQFTVTTIAGSPGMGGNADGVGSEARFQTSQGIARAADGLFVAGFHGSIRRIDLATYEVTTVAGTNGASGSADGPAYDARFGVSFGILSHPDGRRIYYMDRGNNSIRLYDRLAQTVSTVMGPREPTGWRDGVVGESRFSGPRGLYASADGSRIWVADRSNHVVREFDVASGHLATIAGLPGSSGFADGVFDEARFNQPEGLWADASNTFLYVTDYRNHAIRKIELATGAVSTVAGAPLAPEESAVDGPLAEARFELPAGIVGHVDGEGVLSLFVADFGSDLIRVLTLGTEPTVTTLAGGGEGDENDATAIDGIGTNAVFNGPFGIALTEDAASLYVSDRLHHVIRRVDVATGEVVTVAGDVGVRDAFDGVGDDATFAFPEHLVIVGDDIFVADRVNYSIRRIARTDYRVTTPIGELGVSGGTGYQFTPLSEARLYFSAGVVVVGDDIVFTADQALLRVADFFRGAP